MRLAAAALLLLAVACTARTPSDGREGGPGNLDTGAFTENLNGFRIHYEVRGHGPVLMTVPNSWGLTLDGLRGLYRPLEERFTVVYFDPRGMGGSGPALRDEDLGMASVREDFHALRQRLGLDRVRAIGWSNGAVNLLVLASERPETISAAVFLHGLARFGEEEGRAMAEKHPAWVERYAAFLKEMTEAQDSTPAPELNARLKEFYLDEAFPALFADPEAGRRALRDLYADTGFSWAHTRHSEAEAPTFDLRGRLPHIRARSLVISGAHDLLPPDRGREVQRGIPGASFLLFENSGHFAPLEEPERFREAVAEFLLFPGE